MIEHSVNTTVNNKFQSVVLAFSEVILDYLLSLIMRRTVVEFLQIVFAQLQVTGNCRVYWRILERLLG